MITKLSKEVLEKCEENGIDLEIVRPHSFGIKLSPEEKKQGYQYLCIASDKDKPYWIRSLFKEISEEGMLAFIDEGREALDKKIKIGGRN